MAIRQYPLESLEMISADKKFWEQKRVLVTGFEGFLGSNLTKALLQEKAKVIGLDIKTFRKETILDIRDYKRIAVYKGNVANRNLIRSILRRHSIDVVFHLAAEAIVSRSYKNPLKAFESNIAGTWELLEAVRQHPKIEAVVVASSDKAYGSHQKLPYRENAPLIANHPYDVSKSCADLIAHTYATTYNLPVAVTRCGNIYGPGDFNFSRLVPDALRCLFLNKRLKIRSDGKFVRDYVYVDDIVSGYLKIAQQLQKLHLCGEVFNLSDENPLSVLTLLKEMEKLNFTDDKLDYQIMNTAKYEIKKQYLCSSKARSVLSWKPAFNLSGGLKETAKWYKEYFYRR
ncbi:MAG TPA: GDP-mannose 4,6-dehydratase [Candidatus Omnitrophota bacterium]|nr:GDP-mannose 4,6-dehydratase [Candidatus Omnitrophota bacterium]